MVVLNFLYTCKATLNAQVDLLSDDFDHKLCLICCVIEQQILWRGLSELYNMYQKLSYWLKLNTVIRKVIACNDIK